MGLIATPLFGNQVNGYSVQHIAFALRGNLEYLLRIKRLLSCHVELRYHDDQDRQAASQIWGEVRN